MSEPKRGDVRPALSAEEWAVKKVEGFSVAVVLDEDGELKLWHGPRQAAGFIVISRRDALAALCLHGQPFGFTREDVEDVRLAAHNAKDVGAEGGNRALAERLFARRMGLADRLEALLPPVGLQGEGEGRG